MDRPRGQSHRWLAMSIVFATLLFAPAVTLRAQVLVRQDFDGPEPTWREGRGSPGYRITNHERTSEGAHGGSGCEFFRIVSGASGTFVHLVHDLAPARVISELKPSLWVRSDRPGIQLRARVVFPRSINPSTNQPDSVLIAGTSYTRAASWEMLRIDDVPNLVAAQARVLRAEMKRDVDTREAFVDRLVLNLYTGSGQTLLWIDDLEVAGFVGETPQPVAVAPAAAPTSKPISLQTPPPQQELVPPGTPVARREGAKLNGSVLTLRGRPFFPRVIEHQGEPLTFLKERGFNAVRLRTLPPSDLLADAARIGMWIVCPPPMPAGLDVPSTTASPLPEIGPEFDSVLAWDLGEGLTGRELDAVKRWAEQVRRADKLGRPIICGASAELRAYSAPGRADVLVLDRFTPSTSFELSDYRRWLRERPRFARHGTPVWSTVPTEPAPSLVGQINALSSGRPASILAGTEQTRLVAYTALGSGARALLFASHAPLTGQDADTRWRAKQLELLNYELELIEPWIAGGTLTTSVTSTDNEIQAAVLQASGAYMVLPVWTGRGAQYVPGHTTATAEISFVVPGVPETMSAFEVWPGGMRKLRAHRVTGGMAVAIDDFGITSMILLAQDMLGETTRRTAAAGDRATRLLVEMTRTKLQIDSEVRPRLTNQIKPKLLSRGDVLLKTADTELQAAEGALGANNLTDAFRHAQFSLRNLRAMERDYWTTAVTKLATPVSSPYAVMFSTLPQHFSLITNVESAKRMANQLPEGNFEDLGRAINAGWKHYQHPPEGVREEAELSQVKYFEGKHCLRLAATALDPDAPPDQIETPPGWITSPPINVEAGTLLRLHGRVLVPTAIKGSPDGLLILDSLGGEALAERVTLAADWKEFTAYRIADSAKTFTLTFALTGLGEVWIDDVTIEPVAPRGTPAGGFGAPASPTAGMRFPFLR
ncbi:MAG TPA: hypothetical protein VGN12_11735 [Pirellulales bacterium]